MHSELVFLSGNNVDCGTFLCFFFDFLSRGINLTTGNNPQEDIHKCLEIGSYHEWIALSCCLNRFHKIVSGKSIKTWVENDGCIHILN